MEERVIKLEKRTCNTKHSVRELRKKGFVPGVIYGQKIGNIPVYVSEKDLTRVRGVNLFKVSLPEGAYPTMIREIQKHPVSGELLHVDFQQVELDRKIKTEVPVYTVGIPDGQKNGGILQLGERVVEIEALPREIPEHLEVDVTSLGIGDKYTVADLQKSTSLKILTDMENVIASLIMPKAVETEETHELESGEEDTEQRAGEE